MDLCVQCGKPCIEEKVSQRRDGSTLILARHRNRTAHKYSEWPNFEAFINRKYPNDARRRFNNQILLLVAVIIIIVSASTTSVNASSHHHKCNPPLHTAFRLHRTSN